MQIRRSVLFFGPIRQSNVIFAQIRICSGVRQMQAADI